MTTQHPAGPDQVGESQVPAEHAPQTPVEALRPDMGGRWEVCARSSTHIWDLDSMTYTRLPGLNSTPMPYDGVPVSMTRVEAWPAVGQQALLFFDDPDDPAREHWRICSTIRVIVRLPSGEGDPLSA